MDSDNVVDTLTSTGSTAGLKRDGSGARMNPSRTQTFGNRLLGAKDPHQVSFYWVKGHDGHPQNERCDELATTAADGDSLIEDEGLNEN